MDAKDTSELSATKLQSDDDTTGAYRAHFVLWNGKLHKLQSDNANRILLCPGCSDCGSKQIQTR